MTEEREAPGVPAFARSFPRDAALDALVLAFVRGDYARVRREAPTLAGTTESEDVRKAARELVARTRADPLAVVLLVMTAVLLGVLSGWWWRYGGPANAAPSPKVERPR